MRTTRYDRCMIPSSTNRGAPWWVADGLILHGNNVFIPASSTALPEALRLVHTAGQRLHVDFFVKQDQRLVWDFVRLCMTCQCNKTKALDLASLLQPLEVPSHVWEDISLNFIEGLPRVHGESVILTMVDKFSKYVHFIDLSHPYTSVTRAFFDTIVRFHGFPRSIINDRDYVFIGLFGGTRSSSPASSWR